ncbi:MAG: replicative DNA helicase [Tidjanibacter sp.]|nr:replicative DNA helicase [Tidjanibacter sp.]
MAEYNNSNRGRANNRNAYSNMVGEEQQGYVQPQALDLEEAVLGALMLEKDGIITVQEYLSADSFYSDAHKTVYKAIEELASELKPIDLLTVTEKLKQQRKLKEVGGAQFLAKLTQKVASGSNLEFHSTIVAQKYVQRELIRASRDILNRSYDESEDLADLLNFAEQEIFKVAEGHISKDVQNSQSVVRKTLDLISEAVKKGGKINGVPTGFTKLDEMTLGWQPSDMIIIAARPSMGKTAFVLSMARNIVVDEGKPVAFFSLEMSATQLMMRLLVAESQLNSKDVRSGRLTTEQWNHLELSAKPLTEAPLFIDDTPALPVSELRSKVRKLKAQHDIQLVIIDYLQLMTGPKDTKGNREQEVAYISRTLKAIAKELNIPIIALSQLNRSVESQGGSKRPQLSNLRESGAIEQDADIVAFIHRPEYYGLKQLEDGTSTENLAEIIVAKHRNGEVDTIKMKFRKEFAQFSDFDPLDTSALSGDREYGSALDGGDPFGGGSFGGGGGFDGSGFESAMPPTSSAPDGSQARGSAQKTYDDAPF